MKPAILIIIGISGDLASRKLLPALGELAQAGVLPEKFRIIGTTRQASVTVPELLKNIQASEYLLEHTEVLTMDTAKPDDYPRLVSRLAEIEQEFTEPAQYLFYLSVPPQVSYSIIEQLGMSGLAKKDTKLLLEKPFGVDFSSAQELVDHVNAYFLPEQIYRIDHYLAKEMAQNLIVFREQNSLFKRTWDNRFIESIEITASEKIGIEGRAHFYEQTGALRDLVQSHLLQLAAIILMQTPRPEQSNEVPERRLKALQQLQLAEGSLDQVVTRGQYATYKEEVANSASSTETFVSLVLKSSDPRWLDVPIRITTGKGLDKKITEIRITYRQEEQYEANQLLLRLQPEEAVTLSLWTKVPGYERAIEEHALNFAYSNHFISSPEAYSQVFLSALNADHSLFTGDQEVLESWRILAPIQEYWQTNSDDLKTYSLGSKPEDILP